MRGGGKKLAESSRKAIRRWRGEWWMRKAEKERRKFKGRIKGSNSEEEEGVRGRERKRERGEEEKENEWESEW